MKLERKIIIKVDDRIVVIHQPDFLPYLGFFDRLMNADIFIILDIAQYVNGTSRSWMNRDKIKTQQGEKWITISVKKAPRETKIKDILLVEDAKWKRNNLNMLRENYKKCNYYDEVFPYIEELYQEKYEKMIDFNIASIEMLMKLFDINIKTILASDLNPIGKNNELVIDLVKKVGGNKYLSGVGAKDYFVANPYDREKIEVIWQDFKHPIYEQQFGEFIPYLSSVDLLFNCGIERSRQILRGELR